jgi:hypothetical protein
MGCPFDKTAAFDQAVQSTGRIVQPAAVAQDGQSNRNRILSHFPFRGYRTGTDRIFDQMP